MSSGKVNHQAGFTLFELLVVLCILAILCGLAVARLNVKDSAASAWAAVNESAFQAAEGALVKALVQDPENPPTLEDLARSIDSKRAIYIADCFTASSSTGPPPASTGLCLALDIDGDRISKASEVFAAAYSDGECQNEVTLPNEGVCCLERPFFDTSFIDPVPSVGGAGQSF